MASADDLITARFRFQVPRALQPASRSLAALHATRARLLQHPGAAADALRGTHCARCGAYLLDGSGSVRVVRVPRGRARARGGGQGRAAAPCARVLRRTCGVCGGVEDVPVVRQEEAGGSRVVGGGPAEAARAPVESACVPSAAPSRQPSATPGVVPKPSVLSASSSKAPSTPSEQTLDARAKSRPKKKPGLQDLLARNRERQEQEKKAGAGNGLASFLQGL